MTHIFSSIMLGISTIVFLIAAGEAHGEDDMPTAVAWLVIGTCSLLALLTL